MTVAQKRNDSMQALNSVDQLRIQDRNFSAEWVDTVGGGNFAVAITVPLATERLNTAPTVYSMVSDILTLAEAGIYFFTFAVTVAHAGSAEMIFSMYLEEDPDTGVFATVLGTLTTATFFVGQGTAFNTSLVRAGIDYRYRLQVASLVGGSNSLFQNGSKLSVIRLWQNG